MTGFYESLLALLKKDTRFVPFAGPFLLGALTGGVAVGALGPRPRPYNAYPPRPYYYPYY